MSQRDVSNAATDSMSAPTSRWFSEACGVVAVLVIVLWAQSYLAKPSLWTFDQQIAIASTQGKALIAEYIPGQPRVHKTGTLYDLVAVALVLLLIPMLWIRGRLFPPGFTLV